MPGGIHSLAPISQWMYTLVLHKSIVLLSMSSTFQPFTSICTIQAIFDTDPKLDHAPIVLYCASSAIKEGHSMAVSDVQWIPSQIQLCQKTAKVLENQSQKCNQIVSSSIDG